MRLLCHLVTLVGQGRQRFVSKPSLLLPTVKSTSTFLPCALRSWNITTESLLTRSTQQPCPTRHISVRGESPPLCSCLQNPVTQNVKFLFLFNYSGSSAQYSIFPSSFLLKIPADLYAFCQVGLLRKIILYFLMKFLYFHKKYNFPSMLYYTFPHLHM